MKNNYRTLQMKIANRKCEHSVYAMVFFFHSYSVVIAKTIDKLHSNFTKAVMQNIRVDEEILDDKSWDDFPVVHDYFYESDEESEQNDDEDHREYSHNFQPLCQNVRKRVELRSEVYEYHPSHYVETVCRKFTTSGLGELSRNTFNQMCAQPGFACVQRTRSLYLTRRRYDSNCWETTREVIASGCDCMWPGAIRTQRN